MGNPTKDLTMFGHYLLDSKVLNAYPLVIAKLNVAFIHPNKLGKPSIRLLLNK